MGLASRCEFFDDEIQLRFTLREGVLFHRGGLDGGEAAKNTLGHLRGEESAKGPPGRNWTPIREIVVAGPFVVDVRMERPDLVMITMLAEYGMMIAPPEYGGEVAENIRPLRDHQTE